MTENYKPVEMSKELSFYPAVILALLLTRLQKDCERAKKVNVEAMTFWDDISRYKYDKLLISSYFINDFIKTMPLKNKQNSVFDEINFRGSRMIDSGGFQVWSQNKEIPVREVIDCYHRERADYGFVLDSPNDEIISDRLTKKVIENINLMLKRKEELGCETKIMNVMHGQTIPDMNRYYNDMSQFNEQLDGWAVGAKPTSDPILQMTSFMNVHSKDETMRKHNVHFLGVSGTNVAPVLIYLKKLKLTKNITFDSTSYAQQAIYGQYTNPLFIRDFFAFGYKNNSCIENLICNCPVCTHHTAKEIMSNHFLMALHNMYVYVKFIELLESFPKKNLREYIMSSSIFNDKCKTAIDMLDFYAENDFDKTHEKYKSYMSYESTQTEQTKIASFDKW